MRQTVADALALAVKRHGVTEIFGQSLPSAFFLSAARHGLRQVSYRTENAGGAMADGYARITGRVGVVGAQNGPAATLLVAPFAEALKASVPLVGFIQDVPRAVRDRNGFQELDHFELFKGCTKWIRQLTDPARVDDYVDMAFTAAASGRPGPAVLMLPKDILVEEAGVPPLGRRTSSLGSFPLDRGRADAGQVARAARLLADAERPLVVAGGGVHLSGAYRPLQQLQAVGQLPVATTTMGKGSVDESDPLSAGQLGSFMGRTSPTRGLREYVAGADVVLLVGSRTNENGTDTWRALPTGATYIHVDVDPVEVNRNYDAVRLVGDAYAVLDDLVAELRTLDLGNRLRTAESARVVMAAAREQYADEARAVLSSGASPIRPERVMAELDQLLTADTIVVADASYSTIWMAAHLRARRSGQRFLSPRGLAGLGWGLPMALGAKLARPDSPVVCVVGDGGFGHVWAELETSVRENLPVTLIVLNNSILGFQKHAELFAFAEYTSAIDFQPVDHAAVARAVGARGIRVESAEQLRPALREALDADRLTLVEVLTDPDAYPPITAWDGQDEKMRTTLSFSRAG
jgi:acetolactate synthase-1/2/3 large subunit